MESYALKEGGRGEMEGHWVGAMVVATPRAIITSARSQANSHLAVACFQALRHSHCP